MAPEAAHGRVNQRDDAEVWGGERSGLLLAKVEEDLTNGLQRRFLRFAASAALLLATSAVGILAWRGGGRFVGEAPAPQLREATPVDTEALQSLAIGCTPGQLPNLWAASAVGRDIQVRVLTYNLFWWNLFRIRHGNGGSATRLIAQSGPYDLMGFQECEDITAVLRGAGLFEQFGAFAGDGSATGAICMAYRRASWLLLSHGMSHVAEDNLGKRAAQWMRLSHAATGKTVFFMNHHGPLPVNTGGRCGGPATAFNLLQLAALNAQPGDAIIIVGDFNANGDSLTVQHLQWRLHRVYAGAFGSGIDNVFSNVGPAAVKETRNLGCGGSDHDALKVILTLGKLRPWFWPWPLPWWR